MVCMLKANTAVVKSLLETRSTIPLSLSTCVVQQTGPLAKTPFMELAMHLTLEFTNLMGME